MDSGKIQKKLENLTKKWWFYVIITLIAFFLYPITSISYNPAQIPDIIIITLSTALTPFIILAIIMKMVLLILIALLVILKDKISRIF